MLSSSQTLDGQFTLEKRTYFIYLEIKEQHSVELLTMSHLRLLWEINMMRWLMFGVLVCFVMNFAQAMLLFSLLKVDKRPIEKF